MKVEFRNPRWENGSKKRIRADLVNIFDDGTEQSSPAFVSKDSPDWEKVLEVASIEKLDKQLEDDLDRHKTREARREQDHKDQMERRKQEDLFALKLEIFEIEAIKKSKDRKAKSKIRKAKSAAEAMIYASVLVSKLESEDE